MGAAAVAKAAKRAGMCMRDVTVHWPTMDAMAIHDLSTFRHDHAFDAGNRAGERRTWIVVAITAATMVAEIVAGWITGSMALLADGWHMATHVVALSIAGLAYYVARRWARAERFA